MQKMEWKASNPDQMEICEKTESADGKPEYKHAALAAEIDLLQIPLFAGIRKEELTSLLGCLHARIKSYEKDVLITPEQQNIKELGIVLQGQVRMIKTDIWGRETLMTYMQPLELFGESFALTSDQTSVSFQTGRASRILFISARSISHVCSRSCAFHYQLNDNLLSLMAEKNRQLMEKIDISSRDTLREKILAYLSVQAQDQNSAYIQIPLSRSDLALYLQANRSALSRELSRLKQEGILDYDRNTFLLKQKKSDG